MNRFPLTHRDGGDGPEPVASPQALSLTSPSWDSLRSGSVSQRAFLLFGLLIRCPYGQRLEGCPLCRFHHIEWLEEKFLLARQWDETELEQLLAAHNQCYWHRVRPLIPVVYGASGGSRRR